MCRALINDFSQIVELPIKIDDVANAIKERGYVTHIIYHPEDVDPEHLAGMLFHSVPPVYSAAEERADIVYSTRMHPYYQRLVACKEMLHTTDPDPQRTSSRERLSALITELCMSAPAWAALGIVNHEVLTDRLGMLNALAVLIPATARNAFKERLDSGAMTLEDISDTAEIPIEYVETAMLDAWPDIISALWPNN